MSLVRHCKHLLVVVFKSWSRSVAAYIHTYTHTLCIHTPGGYAGDREAQRRGPADRVSESGGN